MHDVVTRNIERLVLESLITYQAVAVLGAKQSGKTTFIKTISEKFSGVHYFNLKKWEDLDLLSHPEELFITKEKITFCLDNIQMSPELLSVISEILVAKHTSARFIVSGTMSVSEFHSLFPVFRIPSHVIELTPFSLKELYHPTDFSINKHWLRGGFPASYFASSDSSSALWRQNYLKSFIEYGCPGLGIQLSGMQTYRLLNLFAEHQDGFLNASKIADMFHVTHPTIRRYIETLEQLYMMRKLLPYPGVTTKRIVKAPKIYIRDSGLLHRLLRIDDIHQLKAHPIYQSSWKGYVIENILSSLYGWESYFYEAASGYKLDLVLVKENRKVAVKIYYSSQEITDNFWNALHDIHPDFTFIIVASASVQRTEENVVLCEVSDFLDFMWREIDLQPIRRKS